MYGNASRVLQTRKTAKNGMPFLIIHYNRDLNTNGHLLLLLADLSFRDKNNFLSKIDIVKPLMDFFELCFL